MDFYYATINRETNIVERIDTKFQDQNPQKFIDGVAQFICVPISKELKEIIQEEHSFGRKFCMEDRI